MDFSSAKDMKTNDLSYCTYLTVYSGNKLPPFYIGSTSIKNINNNYHGSVIGKKYKATWNLELKENPQYFHTKIITTHSDRKEAYSKELFFQESLKVVESPLYINMSYARKNGGFGNNGPMSEETKQKISLGNTGKKHTDETKKKISLAKTGNTNCLGKKLSEETKQKISLGNTGKKRIPFTEETKLKMSHAQRGNTNNLGRHHSEETKKKMSLAQKGNTNTNNFGRQYSEETKLKMSLAAKGRKHSEETKLKMSLTKTGKPYVYSDDGSYTYSIL